MYTVLFKNRAHEAVAPDLATIGRVLKLVLTDVFPDFLYRLWSRKLLGRLVAEQVGISITTYQLTVTSPPSRADNAGESAIGFWEMLIDA